MRVGSTVRIVLAALGLFIGPAVAQAHHEGDIALDNIGGKIAVGVWGESGGLVSQSVFESRFNDTGVDTNWTNEPGFDSEQGTWTYPSMISFNILDTLRVWDGSDFDSAASQQIGISYSSHTAYTPITPSVLAGFAIGVDSNGAWHRHLGFELLDSSVAPGAFAADGIYLLKMELLSSDPLVSKSDPFYIVFQQEENYLDGGIGSEAQHEAAAEYVSTHLVSAPEPGTAVLAAIGLCAAWWGMKRRKASK